MRQLAGVLLLALASVPLSIVRAAPPQASGASQAKPAQAQMVPGKKHLKKQHKKQKKTQQASAPKSN